MNRWKNSIVLATANTRDAIAAIDKGENQIALIVDDESRLQGTVTDGDIRRAILRGVELSAPVTEVMHPNPTVARVGDSRESILSVMASKKLRQIPLVDDAGKIAGIETEENFHQFEQQTESWAVLMAGGLGSRLSPLTDDIPKPMLKVGDKPLLETLIENLASHGFRRIFLAVNYKSEMVKARFGNGADWGVDISYLEEDQRLGTAGAIALLPDAPPSPFLVMNCDLLTNINYRHLLSYHAGHNCKATVSVWEHTVQIPYGVIEVKDLRIAAIEEKPVQRNFINAGIYVLDPSLVELIPPGKHFDMTSLIEKLIGRNDPVSVFPIREFWLDIGHHDDYVAANSHFQQIFK
jgi:dTDP-glucose pyrophosphorylase/predicted transcriptional regulator